MIKLLLDTGVTNSIINTGLCHPKWSVRMSPINVKTLMHCFQITEKVHIPLFSELGDKNKLVEFYVCNFSAQYDGIIGNNILVEFNAIIDLEKNILRIGPKTIPILFFKETSIYHFDQEGFYEVKYL